MGCDRDNGSQQGQGQKQRQGDSQRKSLGGKGGGSRNRKGKAPCSHWRLLNSRCTDTCFHFVGLHCPRDTRSRILKAATLTAAVPASRPPLGTCFQQEEADLSWSQLETGCLALFLSGPVTTHESPGGLALVTLLSSHRGKSGSSRSLEPEDVAGQGW